MTEQPIENKEMKTSLKLRQKHHLRSLNTTLLDHFAQFVWKK